MLSKNSALSPSAAAAPRSTLVRRLKTAGLTAASSGLLALSALSTLSAGTANAKEITVAVSAAFTTLDPWDSPDGMTKSVGRSVYEGLFTFDEKMNPVPELAESWSASPDGRVYTIELKKNVRFHDGAPFNAETVKKNFDRVIGPDARASRKAVFSFIERVEVVDEHAVRFTLKAAHGDFLRRIASTSAGMICPSYIDKYGKDKGLALHACGTGPYIQVEFNPSERFIVKKNPDYRVKGLPKLDGIRWIPVVENNTRAAMLRTGEADFITTVPVESMAALQADPTIAVQEMPAAMQKHLDLNNHFKPFSDKRVRQAVNYAINKEALVKVAYQGHAAPQYGLLHESYPGAVKLGPWPYDPQKARELLKEAGYPNGFETTLWSGYNDTTSAKVVQFLAQQLRQVGIRVETKLLEPGIRSQLIMGVQGPDDAKHRMFLIGWGDSTLDPDMVLRPTLDSREAPPKYFNTAYYKNPAFDALLDQALAEPDAQKRRTLYEQAQRLAWEDAPWAFLYFEMSTGAGKKALKNFKMNAAQSFDFRDAYWDEAEE